MYWYHRFLESTCGVNSIYQYIHTSTTVQSVFAKYTLGQLSVTIEVRDTRYLGLRLMSSFVNLLVLYEAYHPAHPDSSPADRQ